MRPDPWKHQTDGTRLLVSKPAWLLADKVGLGKTRTTIDAVDDRFVAGEIDAMIIVAPATVRPVWADPDPLIGEFAKNAREDLPRMFTEYCTDDRTLPNAPSRAALQVVVTNYEFIRRKVGRGRKATWPNLTPLMEWARRRRTWLVLDESWAVQNSKAKQTVACYKLARECARITLLNGTPGAPEKTFSQFQIMDPRILDCESRAVFELRYCIMGGYESRQVVGYRNMDDYERRTKPYVIRREEGLDLPKVLPPGIIAATLSPATWKAYKEMRDEKVLELANGEMAVARQAGVSHLRLAQILAGFVGGLETYEGALDKEVIRHLGTEKADAIMDYVLAHDLDKLIVWCRFIPEMDYLTTRFKDAGYDVFSLRGGQKEWDRIQALKAFAPGSPRHHRQVLIGQPAAGGAGVNLSGASTAIYATNVFNPKDREQSEGRIDRPGQTERPRFIDVIAYGPQRQRTVDHSCLDVLRNRRDTQNWTAAMWRRAFMGEPLA